MPLLRFDLIEGRSDQDLRRLLDAAHRAVVAAFGVPPADRYHIVHQHKPAHLIVEDTGLGIPRTDQVVLLSITSRPREQAMKLAFYQLLTAELEQSCGIAASDVIVSITTNGDADWSFGLGRAQFLTGEL